MKAKRKRHAMATEWTELFTADLTLRDAGVYNVSKVSAIRRRWS